MALTRTELLRGGAFLIAAGALPSKADAAVPDGDVTYLRLLVAAELLAADFDTQALTSGKLTRPASAVLKQIRADDAAHYSGLSSLMNATGQPPAAADDIDFSYPKQSYASERSILKLGWTLSTLSLGAYLGAVEHLETPELRGPIGQIAANEAQHVSAFAHLLGRPVVGKAFASALAIDSVSAELDRYES
jgi:hypothetical protein